MSYRTQPRTIPELIAWIERRLRRAQRDIATTSIAADHGALRGLGDDDHPQYQLRSEQGAAEGYPDLVGGVVPDSQLPGDLVRTGDLPDVSDLEALLWLTMTEGL